MPNNSNNFRRFSFRIFLFSLVFVFSMFSAFAKKHKHEQQKEEPKVEQHDSVVVVADSAEAELSEAANEHPASEKFDAGKMIMEHVTDSYGWHLWGKDSNSVSIPLPIIIYSSDKERGWTVFSSSRFEHGHKTYKGYKIEGKVIVAVNEMEEMDAHHATVNEEITAGLYDISITKNVASLLMSFAIMLFLFLSVARTYTRNPNTAPKGLQGAIEPIIIFIRDDVAKASIGEKKYARYMPYLLTVFFFIWISNVLGLIPLFPGGANLTGNIAITMTLAILTFIITMISSGKYYWEHVLWMPGVPVLVKVLILTPIEILGVFLKPFVLMIRLFANILAGHIVALSFFSLIFIFAEMSAGVGYGVAVFSWAFTVFMFMLELLVAFLQAYVFTLLSAIYFGAALEEHHDHEHKPHADKNEHIEEAAIV